MCSGCVPHVFLVFSRCFRGNNSVAQLVSLRLLRTRGLEAHRPYLGVCHLVAPGFPFRWGVGGLEGLGSWGERVSRGALVLLIVVSRIPLRPLEDQRPRGTEALSWGLSLGGSRASL